ncbi:MAG: GFA family protein [Candidatus Binataceae bacterium]
MITGSCLCGGVRYEIQGEIGPALNCHCSMCRKMTGAAFRSRVAAPSENFRWTKGEALITRYVSSPGTTRTFCKICGSTLVSLFDDNPKTLELAMGTLDDDPGLQPSFHVFVGSKAPWFEITDGLPQFDAFPPTTVVRQDRSSS